MTPAQIAEAVRAYALDYAMEATFGLTFDEFAAKAAKRNEERPRRSARELKADDSRPLILNQRLIAEIMSRNVPLCRRCAGSLFARIMRG